MRPWAMYRILKMYSFYVCISSSTSSTHLVMHKGNFYKPVIKQIKFSYQGVVSCTKVIFKKLNWGLVRERAEGVLRSRRENYLKIYIHKSQLLLLIYFIYKYPLVISLHKYTNTMHMACVLFSIISLIFFSILLKN